MSDKELLHKIVDDLTESQCSQAIDLIVSEITTQECASCQIGGDEVNDQLRNDV